jgi:hypothetical protein
VQYTFEHQDNGLTVLFQGLGDVDTLAKNALQRLEALIAVIPTELIYEDLGPPFQFYSVRP